ncbi:hypothetical protein C8F01DRAFT_1131632 [Mycena amicta]|nr:hypothetical protein C8F01DRAFT_1131632 [Mycena amicta]
MSRNISDSPILIHALSLRPRIRETRSLARLVRDILKKERVIISQSRLAEHLDTLMAKKRDPATTLASIAVRRAVRQHCDPLPVLSLKAPLPNLISPSNFPSPLTPLQQVLRTPFVPPKATPRPRITADENRSPAFTSPESPISHLTRRFSRVALPSPPKHISRRLSYSQTPTSMWSPEHQQVVTLASPVLIRSSSSLWGRVAKEIAPPPRFELDQLHFSPFQFDVLSF